jgi:hypothetical protein
MKPYESAEWREHHERERQRRLARRMLLAIVVLTLLAAACLLCSCADMSRGGEKVNPWYVDLIYVAHAQDSLARLDKSATTDEQHDLARRGGEMLAELRRIIEKNRLQLDAPDASSKSDLSKWKRQWSLLASAAESETWQAEHDRLLDAMEHAAAMRDGRAELPILDEPRPIYESKSGEKSGDPLAATLNRAADALAELGSGGDK